MAHTPGCRRVSARGVSLAITKPSTDVTDADHASAFQQELVNEPRDTTAHRTALRLSAVGDGSGGAYSVLNKRRDKHDAGAVEDV
jgi:hypothetical protein